MMNKRASLLSILHTIQCFEKKLPIFKVRRSISCPASSWEFWIFAVVVYTQRILYEQYTQLDTSSLQGKKKHFMSSKYLRKLSICGGSAYTVSALWTEKILKSFELRNLSFSTYIFIIRNSSSSKIKTSFKNRFVGYVSKLRSNNINSTTVNC